MSEAAPPSVSAFPVRGLVIGGLVAGLVGLGLALAVLRGLQAQREEARATVREAVVLVKRAEKAMAEAEQVKRRRRLADTMFPIPRNPFGGPRPAAEVTAQIPPPPPRMDEILGSGDLAEVEADLADGDRGPMRTPEAAKVLELAKLKEAAQDMIAALKHLDLANHLEPDHPKVLYRMGVIYDKLGNRRRATDLFQRVAVMGERAGELAGLAIHYLSGKRPGDLPGGLMQRPLRIGPAFAEVEAEGEGTRTVKLSLSIRAQTDQPIDPQAVVPYIYFYDLVDGSQILPCDGEQPPVEEVNPWRSENPDYQDPEEELLDVIYHIPTVGDGRERQFFGYVVKLYYRDEIQDVLAEPRILVDLLSESEPEAAWGSELDPILFENE